MPDFASVTIVTPSLGLLLTTCLLMAAPGQGRGPCCAGPGNLAARLEVAAGTSAGLAAADRAALRLGRSPHAEARGCPARAGPRGEDPAPEDRRLGTNWSTLLRQLDQREKAAIARLVRQYRSDVYETFRKRPRDMVDRQEAWYRIWSLWEKAGSPPEQQDRLMDWLADAIKASTKDSIAPLPPDPKFGDDVELVPEQLVKQLTQPPAGKPDGTGSRPQPPATGRRLSARVRSCRPAGRCRCGFPIRVERSVRRSSRPRRSWPGAARTSRGCCPCPAAGAAGRRAVCAARLDGRRKVPGTDDAPAGRIASGMVVVVPRKAFARRGEFGGRWLPIAVPPIRRGDRRQPSPSPPAAQADQHAQVNVEELGTRIEGINLSLRNLEAELNEKRDSPPINWTPCSAAWTSSCCGRRTCVVSRPDRAAGAGQGRPDRFLAFRRRHHGHPHRRAADPPPRKRGPARGRADCRAEASGRAFRPAGHDDGGEVI